jgi:beta-lactamase class A
MSALGLETTALLSDALPLTAADIALLLEAIARGDAVSEDASLQMAELLVTEKIDDRIPSGVADGTIVAHKTGNWTNATHDAGIVYGAHSTYVVVLLSDIGFDGDAGSVQRDIMRLAWERYEGAGTD